MPARFLCLAAALPLLLAGCDRHPADQVWAEHAWMRLPAVPGRPAAAYLTIHGANRPARLVSVNSPAAGTTELHETLNRSGPDGGPPVMVMDRVDGVEIPAGETVVLAPQGYHAMVFGLSPAVKPGDRVPLTILFAKGPPIRLNARAVAPADPAPY